MSINAYMCHFFMSLTFFCDSMEICLFPSLGHENCIFSNENKFSSASYRVVSKERRGTPCRVMWCCVEMLVCVCRRTIRTIFRAYFVDFQSLKACLFRYSFEPKVSGPTGEDPKQRKRAQV